MTNPNDPNIQAIQKAIEDGRARDQLTRSVEAFEAARARPQPDINAFVSAHRDDPDLLTKLEQYITSPDRDDPHMHSIPSPPRDALHNIASQCTDAGAAIVYIVRPPNDDPPAANGMVPTPLRCGVLAQSPSNRGIAGHSLLIALFPDRPKDAPDIEVIQPQDDRPLIELADHIEQLIAARRAQSV